jgi:hypothetical protein
MTAERPSTGRRNAGPRLSIPAGAAGLLFLALLATPVAARDRVPFPAKAGLDVAHAAARAWSEDAYLVYVENDEDLDEQGASVRWGYLFYSPRLDKARVYSVREDRILVAENLEMRFEAPPLAADWMDSGAALEVAEQKAGREFRGKHGGRLSAMLLMRSAFNDGDPDQTTWTFIYTAADGPSLFVVVDALEGKVRRTWRG